MGFFYGVCAVLGGTVLLCQFAMTLVGLGSGVDDVGGDAGHDFGQDGGMHGGHDAHGDGHDHAADKDAAHHGSTWFFSVVTFRTVVAALAFFGLAGLAAQSADLSALYAFLIALAAGGGAMYGVHSLMMGLHKLKSEGTARIERALGTTGTVYLKIPGHRTGSGKVTLNVQNRTMEYQAVTSRDPLPTGAKVVVVGVIGPDTVEVDTAPET